MSRHPKGAALVLALVVGCARDDLESEHHIGESSSFVSEREDELYFYDGGVGAWPAQNGTGAQEFTYGMAVDAQGNAFVTGVTYGSFGNPYVGLGDIFTTKYSASGGLRWVDSRGSSSPDIPRAAAIDPTGNLVIAGQTYGTLKGLYAGEGDVFLSKTDTNGQVQWTMQYGTPAFDSANDLKIDASGNMLVVGTSSGALHGPYGARSDLFVAKFGSNRALQWDQQYGGSGDDEGRAVAIDSVGNVYVGGTTDRALDVKPHVGGRDAFLTKYSASGQRRWTQQLGSVGNDEVGGVACDANGNVYIAGISAGSVDGNPSAGSLDGFVARYTAGGTKEWSRQFGSSGEDRLYGVSVDAGGNVYLVGRAAPGFDGQAGLGETDAFIVKYNAAGQKQWTRLYGSSRSDEANAIAMQGDAILVAGTTYGAVPGRANAGQNDLFVVRYSASGALLP